ncbi:MAG: hypothetical protein IT373_11505 [Polyangiaceae bacterium]|nr:hypothetical protein [Polyangiaceae bacterium]
MRRALTLFPFLFGLAVCKSSDPATPPATCTDFTAAESTCTTMCSPTNDEFCAGETDPLSCSALPPGAIVDVCGVPLQKPPKSGATVQEMKRSENVDEFHGSGPVDLGCFEPAGYPAPADPASSQLVTMNGIAKIFSHGCESKNVQISVYKVKRTGGADDGDLGDLVGAMVTTPALCDASNSVPEPNDDCGTRFECTFSYPNVPTETELVVVTEGGSWSPLYEYGVFIPNAEVAGGAYDHDVRALDQSDYNSIAQVALGATLTPGKGALAGEVHDCGDVRILNAVVDINKPRAVLTYFTDNEAHPLPSLDANATSTLGLYAAMDVAPGPVSVAAAGVVDGQLKTLGHFRVRIFPDSVTSYTFRGLKPFLVP